MRYWEQIHSSIMRLIVGTPVDAAIGINDLRLFYSDVSNPQQPEAKVSTKPVMDNY